MFLALAKIENFCIPDSAPSASAFNMTIDQVLRKF